MNDKLIQLRDAVKLLSDSAEEQIRYLCRFGLFGDVYDGIVEVREDYNIDELALQFEDKMYFLQELVRNRVVSDAAVRALCQLDSYLDKRSGPHEEDFWTVGALGKDPRWDNVRELADICLRELRDVSSSSDTAGVPGT